MWTGSKFSTIIFGESGWETLGVSARESGDYPSVIPPYQSILYILLAPREPSSHPAGAAARPAAVPLRAPGRAAARASRPGPVRPRRAGDSLERTSPTARVGAGLVRPRVERGKLYRLAGRTVYTLLSYPAGRRKPVLYRTVSKLRLASFKFEIS